VQSITSSGGQAVALEADLASGEAIAAMFAEVKARFGALDFLVANAAATAFRPLLDSKDYNVERTYAITVMGFFRLRTGSRAANGRPERGAIVAISGIDSVRYVAGHGALGSAKAAMETLVRYFFSRPSKLAPKGVRE